ncbi:caspase-3-like [Haliotis rufescens]|uniref:caspase-3-like n=1 Tax=Haliotis rufescens TaxID=6454 RepID=UPI00201EB4A9|nr:caspase-3-like [Haliotis rufescens]XP_048239883.1 caspase-3-like [Haliotis rufescens]
MAMSRPELDHSALMPKKKSTNCVTICMLGPSESGKSELVKYLIKGNPHMKMGVKGACFVYGLRIEDATPVYLNVVECRGDRSSQLQQASKLKPDVFFVLYDVNATPSFKEMRNKWLPELYPKDVPTIVIGNKLDMPSETVNVKLPGVANKGWLSGHMEISSITGQNIDRLIQITVEVVTGLKIQSQTDTISQRMSACSLSDQPQTLSSYAMNKSPKGVCLIISIRSFQNGNSYRHGTETDESGLKEVLQQFDFIIEVKTDLQQAEILQTLKQMSQFDHANYNCFICVVMSHGSSKNITASDGLDVNVDQITKQFTAENCPSLRGKPKVFLFQACRGKHGQASLPHETDSCCGDMEDDATVFVPNEADFLIARSTVDGYVSYRDSTKGSYFISNLVEILRANPELSLVTCLTLLNARVADLKSPSGITQMPCFHTTLRKDLVLGR